MDGENRGEAIKTECQNGKFDTPLVFYWIEGVID